MKILAISGSLRQGSHNTDLLRGAAAAAPDGVDVELYHGLKEIRRTTPTTTSQAILRPPLRLQGRSGRGRRGLDLDPRVQLVDSRRAQERPRLGVPAARGSPVRNKPVAVMSSSTGMFGGVWAAEETRKVLGALGARTIEDTVAVAKADERLANGVDAALLIELRSVVDALANAVEARASVAA